jgi:hypothetical protein
MSSAVSVAACTAVQLSNEQTAVETVGNRLGGASQNITHSFWLPGKVISQENDVVRFEDAPETVTGTWVTLRELLIASDTTLMRDVTHDRDIWLLSQVKGTLQLEVDAINVHTSVVDSRYSYASQQYATGGGYSFLSPAIFSGGQYNTYPDAGDPIVTRSFMTQFSVPGFGSYPEAGPALAAAFGMTAPDPWPEHGMWFWPIAPHTRWNDRTGNGVLVKANRLPDSSIDTMPRFYNASDPNTGYAAMNFVWAFFDCKFLDSWQVGALPKVILAGLKLE